MGSKPKQATRVRGGGLIFNLVASQNKQPQKSCELNAVLAESPDRGGLSDAVLANVPKQATLVRGGGLISNMAAK
jgi:hypothetical protein